MSKTALTPVQLKQNNYAVQATDLAITFASDAVNGNLFGCTGKEILLVQNADSGAAHTFTVTSVADALGRSGDIAAYSIPASGFAAIQLNQIAGWKETDGNIYVSVSDSHVMFCVLRIN
jgi:hypothetical protein